jgi:hypothetical protein
MARHSDTHHPTSDPLRHPGAESREFDGLAASASRSESKLRWGVLATITPFCPGVPRLNATARLAFALAALLSLGGSAHAAERLTLQPLGAQCREADLAFVTDVIGGVLGLDVDVGG